jgi:2-keto-4-pentenoate hydratase
MGVHPSQDAFAPVEWLVGFLHQRGIGLYAGQVVITGSLDGLWRLPLSQPITLEFADQAAAQVEFSAAVRPA